MNIYSLNTSLFCVAAYSEVILNVLKTITITLLRYFLGTLSFIIAPTSEILLKSTKK